MELGFEFPKVEFRDVYVDGEKAERFRAVVSAATGHIYDIVSDRYEIVPHEKVIESIGEITEDEGFKIRNEKVVFGGKEMARMFYSAILEDATINGDKISLGVMVTNSYDRSIGFSVSGFGFRIACMNQLVFGNEILRIWSPHVKSLKVNNFERLEELLKEVIHNLGELKEFLRATMKDAISATELAQFIDGLKVSERLKRAIVEKIKRYTGFDYAQKLDAAMAERAMINRWMAYNALTDALTHDAKNLEPLTVYNLQKKASTLLVAER